MLHYGCMARVGSCQNEAVDAALTLQLPTEPRLLVQKNWMNLLMNNN